MISNWNLNCSIKEEDSASWIYLFFYEIQGYYSKCIYSKDFCEILSKYLDTFYLLHNY